ncbi:unnamed protein product, partial [Ixodes hexagonus]
YLRSLARGVQKQATLLALIESLQSGKTVNEARLKDVAYAVQSLYHCAGWATHLDESFPNCRPRGKGAFYIFILGVVAVVVNEPSAITAMAAWRVAEILATGNAVVLLVCPQFCLSAFLFAEIVASAGLPKGVFNVLAADQHAAISSLRRDALVDAVFFIGRTQSGLTARQELAGCKTSFSSYYAGRLVAVVLEGADLHSAACGICEAFAGSYGKGEAEGVHLFVQESIHSAFLVLLTKQFSQLRVGVPNDKTTDLSCYSAAGKLQTEPIFTKMPGAVLFIREGPRKVASGRTRSIKRGDAKPLSLASSVGQLGHWSTELFLCRFRVLEIAASHSSFLVVDAWSWDALEQHTEFSFTSRQSNAAARSVHAQRHCWIFESSSSSTPCSAQEFLHSLYPLQGLLTFLKPAWSTGTPVKKPEFDFNAFGNNTRPNRVLPGGFGSVTETSGVDKTFKLFYAGQQKRPESNTSYPVYDSKKRVVGYAPDAGKKDVRNAVEAASAGFKSWSTRTAHNRSQVLYYVAENLSHRAKEFATRISDLDDKPLEESEKVVTACIRRLFYWAGACDKEVGSIQGTTMKGSVLSIKEPLGVIGVVCSDSTPLLSFVSLVAAAIAAGNSVVALTSERFPLSALQMCEVFATSDVPAGVVNVLSGYQDPMVRTLAEHHDVDSVWYHGDSDVAEAFVEYAAAHNGKTTWIRDEGRDWNVDEHCTGRLFAAHGTATKTVWLPSGEVFAN